MKSSDKSCFIIAEAGVNHNGDPDLAHHLIDIAADAGADAIKFQTFDPAALVTGYAEKAAYQKAATGQGRSQRAMLEKLALKDADFIALKAAAETRGLVFMSTAFDNKSLDFLSDVLGLRLLKIASGEITNAPFLYRHAQKPGRMILSTGMADITDITFALGIIAYATLHTAPPHTRRQVQAAFESPEGQAVLQQRVSLLQCTSAYPAPDDSLDLKSIITLREHFGLPTGLSDHSQGIAAAIAAVALGATVVEKHITPDRTLPGPDHRASLEYDALKAMVDGIRTVEKALGDGKKHVKDAERINLIPARKSIVAAQPIRKGEPYSDKNLTLKRPGTGLDPFLYWSLIGQSATRAYALDELIAPADRKSAKSR